MKTLICSFLLCCSLAFSGEPPPFILPPVTLQSQPTPSTVPATTATITAPEIKQTTEIVTAPPTLIDVLKTIAVSLAALATAITTLGVTMKFMFKGLRELIVLHHTCTQNPEAIPALAPEAIPPAPPKITAEQLKQAEIAVEALRKIPGADEILKRGAT